MKRNAFNDILRKPEEMRSLRRTRLIILKWTFFKKYDGRC
jgi:hypothetical protein